MNDFLEHNQRYLRRAWTALTVFLVVAAALLFVIAINAVKENRYIGSGIEAVNTITVTGEGEVFQKPDIATFNFSVFAEAKTVDVAQREVGVKIVDLLDAVRDLGIEEKDIKTISYNVRPLYTSNRSLCGEFGCQPERGALRGYEVMDTIEVKIRNVSKSGAVLDALAVLNVSNVSGLNFSIDNEDELKRQARAQAIDEAQDKAKALADDLDVRLGAVVSFREDHSPVYFQDMAIVGRTQDGEESGLSGIDIPPGENRIISNVTITYQVL